MDVTGNLLFSATKIKEMRHLVEFFSYDGENFEKLPEKSTHMHGYTRMGNYKGDPFIVGNYWPQENAETEIMNQQSGQGSEENHLSFLKSIQN